MSGGRKRDVGFVPQVTAPTFDLYEDAAVKRYFGGV